MEPMAKDKRRGGRVTPKGTRPSHLRPVGDPQPERSPVDAIIDSGGRDLIDQGDPIAAETWASGILDLFERARIKARLEGMDVPPIEEALIERCRQRGDRRAAVVATALAAVTPPPLGRQAASTALELRRRFASPDWLDKVGLATPTSAWVASDVFGDQESLIVGFHQPGEGGLHALVVLVDHNLSGQAKDAWLGDDLDEVVGKWGSTPDPHMVLSEAPVNEVLKRLRDAMAMSDVWNGDAELRTEDFAHHRGLVWARLRRAGLIDDRPAALDVPQEERESLVAEFVNSRTGHELAGRSPGVDIAILAHYLVDLRSDYEGRPLRWSPTVVSLMLGDLAPRKLLLGADQVAAFPEAMRAFVLYAAERTGLDQPFVDEIVARIDEMEPEFLDRIGDPSAAGPAKALLSALQAKGVDLSDVDAINEALDQGAGLGLPWGPPKTRQQATSTAPSDVLASAERSVVLSRFGVLTAFYGKGRKLTQTGQPTLADAKELAAKLGTEDRIDQTIGDRTFKTQSAANLPELGFTIRWAIAAGALRKEHGKFLATATWAKLEGKPLQRWLKAADAIPTMGPLADFHAHHRYRHSDELLDELAPEIVNMIIRPTEFEGVLDWVCGRADTSYEWLAPYMQDPENRRRSFRWDLDLLTRILGWAGIAQRTDARIELDIFREECLAGGVLQLTPAGKWWLANR